MHIWRLYCFELCLFLYSGGTETDKNGKKETERNINGQKLTETKEPGKNGRKRTETDRNGQIQTETTETFRKGQKRTERNKNGQKQIEKRQKIHVSSVTCHISCVTCYVSHVTNANSHSHKPSPFQLLHYARYTGLKTPQNQNFFFKRNQSLNGSQEKETVSK